MIREICSKENGEAVATILSYIIKNLKKGDKFVVSNNEYVITLISKPRVVNFVNKNGDNKSYKARTLRCKSKGKNYTSELINDFTWFGINSNQNHEQLSRDIEGDLILDLLNENNQFHINSDSYNFLTNSLNASLALNKEI